MAYYIVHNGELYHHGILGQKWGIRRYQNEDGSLTEQGRARYAALEKKIAKQRSKIEKYQKKVDKQSRQYLRAVKKQNKAARLKNKALNGWFISDNKRAKLSIKADRLNAKASKMMNNSLKNEAKIRRAEALINKYSRQIAKFAPESQHAGTQFINGFQQTNVSDLRGK